jgi:hypothetical protein
MYIYQGSWLWEKKLQRQTADVKKMFDVCWLSTSPPEMVVCYQSGSFMPCASAGQTSQA